jgi:ubiquinone/menaquinone biosynthesis C-methylase UbiE
MGVLRVKNNRVLLAFTLLSMAPPAAERTPAPVMSFHGAAWLEREGREAEERPQEVIQAMGLGDGSVVADVGCGSGFYSRRLARAVAPSGRVYAVDIQPEMLELVQSLAAKEKLTNVVPVLGAEDDPRLPRDRLDWILLVDVYHEFQNPKAMLAGLRAGLGPRGRVALVEYRAEGQTAAHIRPEHRMSVEQVLREWVPAGFRLVERKETLPSQHLFVFEKDPRADLTPRSTAK